MALIRSLHVLNASCALRSINIFILTLKLVVALLNFVVLHWVRRQDALTRQPGERFVHCIMVYDSFTFLNVSSILKCVLSYIAEELTGIYCSI